MKVTLRNNYTWENVVVEPSTAPYNSDMAIEMDTKDVIKILEIQVEFEALQQRLKPLFTALDEAVKAKREAEKEAELQKELAANPEFVELHSDS